MVAKRSLGGIGALYRDNALLGKVYYNLKPDQAPGEIVCKLVFVGDDIDLPSDEQCYRLWLEDGQYLLITLHKMRATSPSPYIGSSIDGVFHATISNTYSAPDQ